MKSGDVAISLPIFSSPLTPLQPVSSDKPENFPAGEGRLLERGSKGVSTEI
jgi:hypothetical protein